MPANPFAKNCVEVIRRLSCKMPVPPPEPPGCQLVTPAPSVVSTYVLVPVSGGSLNVYVVVAVLGSNVTLLLVVADCRTTPPVTVTVVATKLPALLRSASVLGTSSDVAASTVVYVLLKCV